MKALLLLVFSLACFSQVLVARSLVMRSRLYAEYRHLDHMGLSEKPRMAQRRWARVGVWGVRVRNASVCVLAGIVGWSVMGLFTK